MIRCLLPAVMLAGCTDFTTPMRSGDVPIEPAEIPGTRSPPILQYAPYPIHLRWWICEDHEDCDDTREVTSDSMPVKVVAGIHAAVQEVADLLSPTPPTPFVLPYQSNGSTYRWYCHFWLDDHLQSGDTIPAGLTVHVVYQKNSLNSHIAAAAGDCGYNYWNDGWEMVWEGDRGGKPPAGVLVFPAGWRHGETLAGQLSVNHWRRISLHEIGHILGAVNGRYGHTIEASADSTAFWMTAPAIVAAFDAAGGVAYPGRKVPVPSRIGRHWHRCAVQGDVMADAGHWNSRITSVTIAAFWPGFRTEARGGIDTDTTRWRQCPEFSGNSSAVAADKVGFLNFENDWLVPDPPETGRRH